MYTFYFSFSVNFYNIPFHIFFYFFVSMVKTVYVYISLTKVIKLCQ